MKPTVSESSNGLRLNYSFPQTIHDSTVYPLRDSNNSVILISGHDGGVRIIWCHSIDNVRQTEIEDTDTDDNAWDHVDVPLPSAALRLACPNVSRDISESSGGPALLDDHIVIAVACADRAIRLIYLSLQPPSDATTPSSPPQIIEIRGTRHQELISSIALTYTSEIDALPEDIDNALEESISQPATWSFLVASVSCTGSGLLLINRAPVNNDAISALDPAPLRRQALRAPLISAKLAFNTSPSHTDRHTSLLITIPEVPCVRIYQVFPTRSHHRRRRGSVATTDSSSTAGSTLTGAQDGKFLITLLPEFSVSSSDISRSRRKSVLAAEWVAGGRAVIVLFGDATWGIWDIEGVDPSSKSTTNPIRGQANPSGVVGGASTKLAVTGTVRPGPDVSILAKATVNSSRLQPAATTASPSSKGFIHVVTSPFSTSDESIIFTYGQTAIYIPSLVSTWKSAASSRTSTSAGANGEFLLPVDTAGEVLKSIYLLPALSDQATTRNVGESSPPDFAATSNTRITVSFSSTSDRKNATSLVVRSQSSNGLRLGASQDQSLLKQRSLDIDGMDRILQGMNGDSTRTLDTSLQARSTPRAAPNFGQSVMLDDSDDMSIASPVSAMSRAQGGRRAFA